MIYMILNIYKINMPELIFNYGVMNSSKSAQLIMTAYNYRSYGKKIIIMK
jgi:thymidine kinase